jgi:hypothetical protein
MAGLTITQLRALVSMYRRGVEGAAQQLTELATVRPDALASLLHVPNIRADLDEDLASHVADLLDEVDRTKRRSRKKDAHAKASKLGETLGRTAVFEDDRVHLDHHTLSALVATQATGELSFEGAADAPAVIDLGYLRKVLHACRTCRLTELYVQPDHLVLVYASAGARGRFRLTLGPPDRRQEQVRVKLGEPVLVVDAPAHAPSPFLPRSHQRVARRLLDAFSAEVGW